MAILTGFNSYFDCSSDEHPSVADPKTVVAGYVASVEDWAQWEIDWRLALASFDVPYFHMKEFVAYKKAYSHPKWKSGGYRAEFLSTLVSITNRSILASFCSVTQKHLFELANTFFELDKHANPFVMSGTDSAMHVRSFMREKYKSDMPIAYIFEKGDEGKGMLIESMECIKLPSPIFKRPRPNPELDKDDPPCLQLQACDLIAWEIRRGEIDWKLQAPLGNAKASVLLLLKG